MIPSHCPSCLLCLVEGHIKERCSICKLLKKRIQMARDLRLKQHPMEQVMRPTLADHQFPHRLHMSRYSLGLHNQTWILSPQGREIALLSLVLQEKEFPKCNQVAPELGEISPPLLRGMQPGTMIFPVCGIEVNHQFTFQY